MKNSKNKKIIKLIFFNLGFTFLILILIEIGTIIGRFLVGKEFKGFLIRRDKIEKEVKDDPCQQFINHPILGYAHDPNNGCIIDNGKVIGNSILYNEGAEYKKSILIVGSSGTDGFFYQSNGETWPSELTKILKNEDKNFSVINSATGGYNTSKQLLSLLLNIKKFKKIKDIQIIVGFTGLSEIPNYNGLSLWSEKNLPFWNKDHIKSTVMKKYIIVDDYNDRLVYFPSLQTLINRLNRSENNYEDYVKKTLNKYILEDERDLSPYKVNAEKWLYNVRSMHAIANSIGAEYYVFLQPGIGIEPTHIPKNINSNDYKLYKDYKFFDKELNEDYYVTINKLYKELRILCRDIPYCIDISKELPPIGNKYKDIRHLNEKGNKELSEIIVKYIFPKK